MIETIPGLDQERYTPQDWLGGGDSVTKQGIRARYHLDPTHNPLSFMIPWFYHIGSIRWGKPYIHDILRHVIASQPLPGEPLPGESALEHGGGYWRELEPVLECPYPST